MRFLKFAPVLAGVILAAAPAGAQSIYGPGGLFLNPTADFAPKGSLTPAALYIPENDREGKRSLYSLGANYAVSDKLEAGVSYLKLAPGLDAPHGSYGGSLKFRLRQGRGWSPSLAAGGVFLGGGDLNTRTAFLAAKFVPNFSRPRHPINLHLGLLYANQIWGGHSSEVVPYVGATVGLTKGVTAFAEYRQKLNGGDAEAQDIKAPNAVGVIFAPDDSYKVALAYANNGHSTDNKLSVGVGFTLGSRRTTGGSR